METLTPSTRNVMRVFRTATEDQIERGMTWYADAHDIAQSLGQAHDTPTSAVAGMLAAMSPLIGWGHTVTLTTRYLRQGGLTGGYLRRGIEAADKIYRLADPLDVLHGPKVRAFYLSILHAGETDAVCVDRHAYGAATGRRLEEASPKITVKRSREAQEVYRRGARIAAREMGAELWPAQFQAIVWEAFRQKFWSADAFQVPTFDADGNYQGEPF